MGSLLIDNAFFEGARCRDTSPEIFDRLSRVITKASVDGFIVRTPGDAYEMVCGGVPLWSVLFERPSEFGLDQGEVSDILRLLDQCSAYEASIGPEYAVRNPNAPSSSSAYQEAYQCDLQDACGVLVARPYLCGIIDIERLGGGSRSSFLVCEERDLLSLYRFHLARNVRHTEIFKSFSIIAFPSLLFVSSVSPADLGINLSEYGGKVVEHLSFLNDDYIKLCGECAWDLPRIQAAARARGVDLSDESSSTKADPRKMRERNVSISVNGVTRMVSCTLHTKLTGQVGRIHYAVERRNEERQIVVGIMHSHLSV